MTQSMAEETELDREKGGLEEVVTERGGNCGSWIIYESTSRECIVSYLKIYSGTTENSFLVSQRV